MTEKRNSITKTIVYFDHLIVVYFNQLLGVARNWKLIEILFLLFSTFQLECGVQHPFAGKKHNTQPVVSFDLIYALDTKEQSVRANDYSLSTWKCLPEVTYSTVRKGHKTKPE